MEDKRFIKINSKDSDYSDTAFKDLMGHSEKILNNSEERNKKLTPKDVEQLTVCAIKKATGKTDIFRPSDVTLVSGFQFPDIKIEPSYGVEVKSSQSGWCSIGSSIIESTRIPGISLIFMVFGNLKDSPAKFKCRPYENVLTDIKVTHSPRYSIDMNAETTVFSDMGISYDDYRKLNDNKKIELAQKFAREKIKKSCSKEMPWWIKDLHDETSQGNIRLWNSLSNRERDNLVAQCMILFPEILNSKPSPIKYNEATLWLCSYYQIVSPNMRDNFSAGGQIKFIDSFDGKSYKIPAIYRRIKYHNRRIKNLLENPSNDFELQMEIYNPSLKNIPKEIRYEYWLKTLSEEYSSIPIINFIKEDE